LEGVRLLRPGEPDEGRDSKEGKERHHGPPPAASPRMRGVLRAILRLFRAEPGAGATDARPDPAAEGVYDPRPLDPSPGAEVGGRAPVAEIGVADPRGAPRSVGVWPVQRRGPARRPPVPGLAAVHRPGRRAPRKAAMLGLGLSLLAASAWLLRG